MSTTLVPHGASEPARSSPPTPAQSTRILGAFAIAMISLAAVLTLRSMPTIAEYGWPSIAYYILGAVFFLIPLALVAAELATGWPKAGGPYAWVEEAFGQRWGFLAVWFDWIENIVWFPTVLSFVAATIAYVVAPGLANNKLYLVLMMMAVFWALTLANFFGMRWTARLNSLGVIIGTLVPTGIGGAAVGDVVPLAHAQGLVSVAAPVTSVATDTPD